jgi:hypothetical protein
VLAVLLRAFQLGYKKASASTQDILFSVLHFLRFVATQLVLLVHLLVSKG